MDDEQLDAILARLSSEGFALPFMARVNDYITSEPGEPTDPDELAALQAADRESNEMNRAALRSALEGQHASL